MDIGQNVNVIAKFNTIPMCDTLPNADVFSRASQVSADRILDLKILGKTGNFVQCLATFDDLDTKMVWIPRSVIRV